MMYLVVFLLSFLLCLVFPDPSVLAYDVKTSGFAVAILKRLVVATFLPIVALMFGLCATRALGI